MMIMAETKTTKKKVAKKTTTAKKAKVETTKTEVKKEEIKDAKTTIETKKDATKTETKEATKTGKVDEKTEKKTVEKKEVKKKYLPKVKKENKKKSKEAVDIQKTLKGKKKLPTFRGRFGKKNIRRKSNKKWQKWRKPRSIDLDRGLQHGYTPKIGYRNKKELRGIHPSGYNEVMIKNVTDVEKINVKTEAIRISATVGKRKRNEIITKANEKGIWVLN